MDLASVLPRLYDSHIILKPELESWWVFQMAVPVAMYTTELTPIYQLSTGYNKSLGCLGHI